MDAPNTRVVILGKTGAGKSSLGNTIFGETLFEVNHTPRSKSETSFQTRSVNGRRLTLIDTPGFFETNMLERDLRPEQIKCVTESAPGPHAFLILLKVEKYTEHEQADKLIKIFSEEVFKYATVVFTHGDQLQEGQTIEDFVREEENLRELVRKCGGRCHVIDNKYWKENPTDEYRSNKFQVKQLLKTIDEMIKDNKDGYYTNEMLQEVEEDIQQEMKIIKQSSGNLSEEEARRKAKDSVQKKLLTVLADVSVGALVGAFLGAAVMLMVAFRKKSPITSSPTALVASAAVGAVIGGTLVGAFLGAAVVAFGKKGSVQKKRLTLLKVVSVCVLLGAPLVWRQWHHQSLV